MNKARTLTFLGLALATSATALIAVVYRRFQHDLRYSYARIGSLKSQTQELSCGPVEYLTHGQGSPVLLAHVLFGGVDQGLVEARSIFGGFRSILVSRFGYLGSPLPEQASPALQADAYAWLLDALGINQATIVGMSGGALQLFNLLYDMLTDALPLSCSPPTAHKAPPCRQSWPLAS